MIVRFFLATPARPVTAARLPIPASLAIAAGLALAACKTEAPPPPPEPPPPAKTAVDHVDPHEIPEGAEDAFGLPIPRSMSVFARLGDAVRARGELPPDDVANYVRTRVIADRVETGPAKTVFARVTLKSGKGGTLRVEVIRVADRTELYVRDITPPPPSDVVKPTDPWDKPGFDPKDRKADSKRFE